VEDNIQTPDIDSRPHTLPLRFPNSLIPVSIITSFTAVVMIIIASFVSREYFYRNVSPVSAPKTPVIVSPTIIADKNFFLDSVPKPISGLKVEALPDESFTGKGVSYKDMYITAGQTSLLVYSAKTGKLISYSDPFKARCNDDPVIIGKYLYAPCRLGNIEQETVAHLPEQQIFKIDINDLSLVRTYSRVDGLLSGYNYLLAADGTDLWVGTFDGLGKIDILTDKVSFYSNQLGIDATHTNVNNILIDQNYIWFSITANIESSGGLSLYDKSKGIFTGFNLKEITGKPGRFDLELGGRAWKLVTGGIDIGFNTNNETGFIKRYRYDKGVWETLETITTGNIHLPFTKYFPSPTPNKSEIKMGVFNIQSRTALAISDIIGNGRYILTSSTIDYINDSLNYPEIVLDLSDNFRSGWPSFEDRKMVIFNIDPEQLTGFAFHHPWGGDGCIDPTLITFNLKTKRILKKITFSCWDLPVNFPEGSKTVYSDGVYIVYDSQGHRVFTLNMNTLEFKLSK
jgi:hypothetical protein